MNNITEKNIDPKFFVVLKHRLIRSVIIPKHLGELYVVEFADRDLQDPKSDPIALYYTGGIRKFIWRDMVYGEYNIDASKIMNSQCADHELSDMLKRYSRKSFSFDSTHSNSDIPRINGNRATATEAIVRVLYKLKNQRI